MHFNYKGGCGACVSRLVKEQLAWAIGKNVLGLYTITGLDWTPYKIETSAF